AQLIGGPVALRWPDGRPSWATANTDEVYGAFSLGENPIELHAGQAVLGMNMAIDRQALVDLGGFNESMGHGARTGLMGEDNEICARALGAGLTVRYEPAAEVEHRVEPSRVTRRYYLGRVFQFARTMTALDPPPNRSVARRL